MRRSSFFWGSFIILAGVLLLLGNLGLININLWSLIWPLFLILLGVWFLAAPRMRGRSVETRQLTIPLETARQAEIRVRHGAGRLDISASSVPNALISGSFGGGVNEEVSRDADRTRVKLSAPVDVYFPGIWLGQTQGYQWEMGLSPDADLMLDMDLGASENRLDLSGLRVSSVRLNTGASSTDLILPQVGPIRVEVHAGAASVNIRVPQNVPASIRVQTGLSGVNIDTNRFPRSDQNKYQSPDYATAANRAEIYVEAGVGSINIR